MRFCRLRKPRRAMRFPVVCRGQGFWALWLWRLEGASAPRWARPLEIMASQQYVLGRLSKGSPGARNPVFRTRPFSAPRSKTPSGATEWGIQGGEIGLFMLTADQYLALSVTRVCHTGAVIRHVLAKMEASPCSARAHGTTHQRRRHPRRSKKQIP